jgi:predicted N-acetyltransferase YhbS
VEFRVLHPAERERLLLLLDRWDVGDGWRGRDFFRRYLEQDPSFADENVQVAADGDELVSCVQVFPRQIRIRSAAVPMGGIGSVFTAPEWRGRGLARELMDRAAGAMIARGMEVGMLFPAPDRVDWYRDQGWDTWKRRRLWVSGGPRVAVSDVSRFEADRDLEGVRAIHAGYSGALDGTEVRADGLWTASLRNAGNPGEDFRVVRSPAGDVVAYARAIVLGGLRVVTEFGRAPGAEGELVLAVSAAVDERAVVPDPAPEPGLEEALRDRGFEVRPLEDPLTMLRCLAPGALARRLGVPIGEGEAPDAFLRRLLPPDRLHFWVADRF